MAKRQVEITEAELSVMEVLWDHPEGATVREIVLAVYGRHERSLHGGVQSFLDRLQEKRFVKVDKSGHAHRFCAAAAREKFVGGLLKQIADSHFGGSLTPLLLTLVAEAGLSTKQRAAIEKMIDHIRD